jgi:hypothetical protein
LGEHPTATVADALGVATPFTRAHGHPELLKKVASENGRANRIAKNSLTIIVSGEVKQNKILENSELRKVGVPCKFTV